MKYSIRLRSRVVDDLDHGMRWYDQQSVGLSEAFLNEFDSAIDRIAANPERWAANDNGIRSMRMHRFPYVIRFKIDRTVVFVLAVMHGGRDSSAWEDRE